MAFDGIFINGLVHELNQWMAGGRIDKIHQPEADALVLHIKTTRDKPMLYISANASLPHMTVIGDKLANPQTPPMFCMLLRKHLVGSKIIKIEQVGLERVISIELDARNDLGDKVIKRLMIEIMGKHSNIILIDENKKIVDSVKRIPFSVSRVRQLLPGLTYVLPKTTKLNLLDSNEQAFLDAVGQQSKNLPVFKFIYMTYQGFSPASGRAIAHQAGFGDDDLINNCQSADLQKIWQALTRMDDRLKDHDYTPLLVRESKTGKYVDLSNVPLGQYEIDDYEIETLPDVVGSINLYFSRKDKVNRMLQKTQNLRKFLQQRLDRMRKKVQNLNEDLLFADNAEENKVLGDLILANLWQLDKGMNAFTTQNYFDPEAKEITIQLDVRLTPQENAQRYFKKYNKLRTAQDQVAKQLEDTQHEVAYLEQVLATVELTDDPENIEAIRQELMDAGLMKRRYDKKKKNTKKQLESPIHYRSSDGFEILVGKNNLQNDWLTLRHASNRDIWLHTKIIPGSHVIIRTAGQAPPEQTIYEAACIAAWHSKARLSGQVPVDYTEVKHVSKPSGAKPGMVIYQTNQTLYVTPDEEEVQRHRIE